MENKKGNITRGKRGIIYFENGTNPQFSAALLAEYYLTFSRQETEGQPGDGLAPNAHSKRLRRVALGMEPDGDRKKGGRR